MHDGSSASAEDSIQSGGENADVRVVTVDDSSNWSFRRKAQAWLATTAAAVAAGHPRVFELGGERVWILQSGRFSAGQTLDSYLLVRGDFSCGAGCRFQRPIYAGGDCEIGKGTRLESVTAEGRLSLLPGAEVRDCAESGGLMEIRSGCRIWSLAHSRTAIRLGVQAAAGELRAPIITTPAGLNAGSVLPNPLLPGVAVLPAPGDRPDNHSIRVEGIDPRRLRPLGAETWVYSGDLAPRAPILLRSHLVVEGGFACAAGSLLEGDVRTDGSLRLGEQSVARANLWAEGDLIVGAGCVLQGEVRSQQMLRLCAGVRVLRAGGPVSVLAAGELSIEEDVSVRGRIASSYRVLAVSAAAMGLRRVAAGGS